MSTRSPREEMAEATAHGQVYLRRLRRAQLGLSVMALVAFGAVFGVLPLALLLLPALRHATLLGVPLGLWLVVVPMLPLFVAIGWVYARRADALDDAFRDVVER
ncbi:MAG TPA: sodium/substrate symporter small subunit [Solirubrobacteraceae bacterium]|nr:sodium/substrate symporter small subunit [Solirubrobacteraceae bacterium]